MLGRDFDGKGIFRSTHENKLADNNTFHQVGVVKTEGGKFIWNGLHKSMNPDGDYAIWEFYGDSQSGTTMKIIYGSGKNKGERANLRVNKLQRKTNCPGNRPSLPQGCRVD